MPAAQHSWDCMSCGRRVPMDVDTCRCGQDLAGNAIGLVGSPDVSAPADWEAATLPLQLARLAFGYRDGLAWPGPKHRAFAGAFFVLLTLVFGAALTLSSHEPAPTVGNVRLVARLDEFTKNQNPRTPNSIPTFLLLPGLLGALPAPPPSEADGLTGHADDAEPIMREAPAEEPGTPDLEDTEAPAPTGSAHELIPDTLDGESLAGDPTDADPASTEVPEPVLVQEPTLTSDAILPVDAAELSKGFCTPTLSLLIRQRFPGIYDEMPDDELEERALEKYPEYEDSLCVLPAWVSSAPSQIVKYEIEPVAVAIDWAGAVVWSLFSTALFAFVTVNVFYRVIVPLVLAS